MGIRPMNFITLLHDGRKQHSTHYIFSIAGDEIPMHTHPNSYHSLCCLRGSCEVYNSTGKRVTVKAGQFVEFHAGKEHAIKALEEGTEIMNIREPYSGTLEASV